MTTIAEKRTEWIDTAKGVGILCVLLGHISYPFLQTIIYTFHMPLFFFLSGLVYNGNKYDTGEFIKRKVKTLVVPYYLWAVFYFIPIGLLLSFLENKNLNLSQYKTFVIMGRKETIWFLSALFCINLIMYFLSKALKNNAFVILLISVLGFVLFAIYYNFGGKALWLNLDIAFMGLPFFVLGYCLKYKKQFFERLNNMKLPKYIVLIIFLFIVNFTFGYFNKRLSSVKVDMSQNAYGNYLLMLISAISGIMCVVLISQKIHSKFLKYIGQNSIIYFVMHQKIYTIITNCIYPIFNFNESDSIINNTISLVLLPFISLIIITVINFAFVHSRLCIFLGKKYIKKEKANVTAD